MTGFMLSVDYPYAVFSDCRKYRYVLIRNLNRGTGTVVFIGLNPSTADENINDPTIQRCITFARDWGFSRLVMLNLFAFKATKPKDMLASEAPIGTDNDEYLSSWCSRADKTVLCWGNHGKHMNRDNQVLDRIGVGHYCLGVNRNNTPKHPLYLRRDTRLCCYATLTSGRTKKRKPVKTLK